MGRDQCNTRVILQEARLQIEEQGTLAGAQLSLCGGFRKEALTNSHQSQRDEITAERTNQTEYSLCPLWVPLLPPMLEHDHYLCIRLADRKFQVSH